MRTDDSLRREYFARQTLLPGFGEAGQQKLGEARIAIVGLGGLGCPAVRSLAGAGAGRIRLIDSDRVEISNLHRQHLYSPGHEGEFKARAAHALLSEQFPLTRFTPSDERITPENIHRHLGSADLILDCSDNFETKYLIHDYAFLQSKNLVQASIYQYEGTLYSFSFALNGDSGCFRCLWPRTPAANCVGHCGDVGVLSSLAGMVGSMQAHEAVNLLLGAPGLRMREGVFLDASAWEIRKISWPRNPGCPLCSPGGPNFESWRTDVSARGGGGLNMDEPADHEPVLHHIPPDPSSCEWVDIREDEEIIEGDHLLFPGLIHLPLSSNPDYHARFSDKKRVALICESGVRSLRLTRRLRAMGAADVWSLEGGFGKYRNRSGEFEQDRRETQNETQREREPAQV